MTDKNLLTEFKFFGNVTPESLETISQKAEILEMDAGDVIFHFDEPAEHLYGLLKGEVDLSLVFTDRVLKTDIEYEEVIQASIVDEEKRIVVDTVYPGQIFGWASLVGPGRRTVTAQCTESSRMICIQAADLKAMFEKDHTRGYTIMTRLCQTIPNRLKNRTEKLIETWVEAFDANKI